MAPRMHSLSRPQDPRLSALRRPPFPTSSLSLRPRRYITPLGILYDDMKDAPQEHLQPRHTVRDRALAAGIVDRDMQATAHTG